SPFALVSARPHLRDVARGQRDIVARRRGPLPWRAFDGTRQVVRAWLRAVHRSWIAPWPLMLKLYSIPEGRSCQKEAPDRVGFVGTSAKARPRHCEISG